MRQDIDKTENKIRYLKHPIEFLSQVSELKLNEINSKITNIHTSLNNITSSNDCCMIISNQDIDKNNFLEGGVKK